jgi:oligoendopeptidase F
MAVKALSWAVVTILAFAAASPGEYRIDSTRYFPQPAVEAQSRAAFVAACDAFVKSSTPATPPAMLHWLQTYDALLRGLERHDIYVYLRAEEDDRDTADAKADDALGQLEGRIGDRVVRAARQLGEARIAAWTQTGPLKPYRFLLEDSLARGTHRLSVADAHAVDVAVTPVLDAAATSYKAFRKSSDSLASRQDAYAALLVSIAAARNGVARLRGFPGAADAAYFDRAISPGSVERTLSAIRASSAYARYLRVAALMPKPAVTPSPVTIAQAIPTILAAEQPMGAAYAGAYAALLDPRNGRLEICTAPECDDSGFSLGFAGVQSAVFYGGFTGSVNAVRAVAHESGHAVHREFMSENQPIAAYNRGPSFMFESFAIFNELLFLNHLYESTANDTQRAFYLNYFLQDATFQVYGSAEETDLERAIYHGVDDGTIRTAADFNTLTTSVFARYDPSASQDPKTPLYWAGDRLFFTDPLYDVNYLYAGLLALQYFTGFQRDSTTFSKRYVALLKNGFNDTQAALEKRFLGIDLSHEADLVANAGALIDARTTMLSTLYATASRDGSAPK